MNAFQNPTVRTAALIGAALCVGFWLGRDGAASPLGGSREASLASGHGERGIDPSQDRHVSGGLGSGAAQRAMPTQGANRSLEERPAGPGLSSVRDVAAKTRSAVVSLDVIRSANPEEAAGSGIRSSGSSNDSGSGDLSTGAGFVFDPSGLVLTAGHLVEGAALVFVDQPGEPSRFARVIGIDRFSDLAIVQIEDVSEDVPYLSLAPGPWDQPLVAGDWVVTIGGPLGLDQSVGAGLVSHPSRLLRSERTNAVEFYLQLAGPVHPGSSGGPVMDLRGDLVGVTIRKLHDAPGISFALPISTVRRVVARLQNGDGSLTRSHLGASLSRARGNEPDGSVPEGGVAITITSVKPGQAADRAGLQLGDLVVSVDDQPIESLRSFHEQVTWAEPSSEIKLEVWRAGRPMGPLDVVLDRLSDDRGPALMP